MKLVKVLCGITAVSCISLVLVSLLMDTNTIDLTKIVYDIDDIEDLDF